MTGILSALIGLGTVLTAMTVVWTISVRRRDASVADICWGCGFVLLAWLYCVLSPALTPRSWLVAGLVTMWGTRLSAHICQRHHGEGEDPRYQAMRAAHGSAFWWRSLFTVFWLQGAILWFVVTAHTLPARQRSSHGYRARTGRLNRGSVDVVSLREARAAASRDHVEARTVSTGSILEVWIEASGRTAVPRG